MLITCLINYLYPIHNATRQGTVIGQQKIITKENANTSDWIFNVNTRIDILDKIVMVP